MYARKRPQGQKRGKMTIINLTPHPLVLEIRRTEEPMSDDRTYQTVESSGIARCEATETEVDILTLERSAESCGDCSDVDNQSYGWRCVRCNREKAQSIPVVTTRFGAVTGLPDPCEGVVYVVSSITAQAVPDRRDVFVPARPVRDEKGRIVACRALGRIGSDQYHCATCANSFYTSATVDIRSAVI
jgi:hypothetical protein